VNVARQNGKGGILEARELASVFLFGERLVIHSAHEFATSTVAMDRMEELLEEGGLTRRGARRRVAVARQEGFKFKGGQRIGSGRGRRAAAAASPATC
jgi:hypothetical protein